MSNSYGLLRREVSGCARDGRDCDGKDGSKWCGILKLVLRNTENDRGNGAIICQAMVDCLWTAETHRRPPTQPTQVPRDILVPESHREDLKFLSGKRGWLPPREPFKWQRQLVLEAELANYLSTYRRSVRGSTMARIILVKAARPRENANQHPLRAAQSWRVSWGSGDEAGVRAGADWEPAERRRNGGSSAAVHSPCPSGA